MFSKLSPFLNFEKFTLDLSEKKQLVRNMWKVYTRPTSASDIFFNFPSKVDTFEYVFCRILYLKIINCYFSLKGI
jgi:hypothetical protein